MSFDPKDAMTVGELIDLLKQAPPDWPIEADGRLKRRAEVDPAPSSGRMRMPRRS
jgi:hypothetical protein